MKRYQVLVRNKVVKEYPFKIQAIIYCYLNGYVYSGFDEWNKYEEVTVLDGRVKIQAIKSSAKVKEIE